MALYSHKYKLLYIHIYKTGGMSVRNAMMNIDNDCIHLIKGHADIRELFEYFKANDLMPLYDSIYKFSVVRNPYTWVYSIYQFGKTIDSHPFHSYCASHSFEEFIEWYIACTPFFNASPELNGKIQTQSDYICIDNKPQIHSILKYESLADDFAEMMRNTQIPFTGQFPIINVTKYDKPDMGYYANLSRSVLDMFNDYYHDDFVNFKYEKI